MMVIPHRRFLYCFPVPSNPTHRPTNCSIYPVRVGKFQFCECFMLQTWLTDTDMDLIVFFFKPFFFYLSKLSHILPITHCISFHPQPIALLSRTIFCSCFSPTFIYFGTQCSQSKCSMFSVQILCSSKEITFK